MDGGLRFITIMKQILWLWSSSSWSRGVCAVVWVIIMLGGGRGGLGIGIIRWAGRIEYSTIYTNIYNNLGRRTFACDLIGRFVLD